MNLDVHGALDGAFTKIYGYSSNAQGIRRALMDEPDLEFEAAKFMLVACSAFVNYLLAKAARSRVDGLIDSGYKIGVQTRLKPLG